MVPRLPLVLSLVLVAISASKVSDILTQSLPSHSNATGNSTSEVQGLQTKLKAIVEKYVVLLQNLEAQKSKLKVALKQLKQKLSGIFNLTSLTSGSSSLALSNLQSGSPSGLSGPSLNVLSLMPSFITDHLTSSGFSSSSGLSGLLTGSGSQGNALSGLEQAVQGGLQDLASSDAVKNLTALAQSAQSSLGGISGSNAVSGAVGSLPSLGAGSDAASGAVPNLSDLVAGAKSSLEAAAGGASDAAQSGIASAGNAINNFFGSAGSSASDAVGGAAGGAAGSASDAVSGAVANLSSLLQSAGSNLSEDSSNALNAVESVAENAGEKIKESLEGVFSSGFVGNSFSGFSG